MRNILLLVCFPFLVCLLCSYRVAAQIPEYVWDKTIGSNNSDLLRSIVQTPDGGFAMVCWSGADSSGDKTENGRGGSDYWIIRCDKNGNKVWDKTYGGSSYEEPFKIRRTHDGGFIVSGYTDSDSSGDKTQDSKGLVDYWVVRLDSNGNKIWDKDFGGNLDDLCHSVVVANDGGFLLVGDSPSDSSGDKTSGNMNTQNKYTDYWVVKIDSLGDKEWDKTIGGKKNDVAYDGIATPDGGFIIVGSSGSPINTGNKTVATWGGDDAWIIKLDSMGNILWQTSHGGSSNEGLGCIDTAGGNYYFVSGVTTSGNDGDKISKWIGGEDFWVMKIDSVGNKLWDSTYGGLEDEDSYAEVYSTHDGGFVVSGTSYSDSSGTKKTHKLGEEQGWIQKADSNGTPQWDVTLQTWGHDEEGYGIPNSEGCYFFGSTTDAPVGGYKSDPSKGYQDAFLLKFCSQTALIPVSSFFVSNTSVCDSSCISFTDQSIQNPISWQWNFAGGSPDTSSLQNPSNICYNTPGSYSVTLITSNSYGKDTLTLSNYIMVFAPFIISISQNGNVLTCSPAAPSYQWSLNAVQIPGATSQSLSIGQTGNYSVEVIDSNGCTSTATLNVISFSSSNFSASDTSLCQKFCVAFTDQSTNNPNSWQWSFPGGTPTSSTDQNPTNICYDSPGTYDVTLITTNSLGSDTLTLTNYITVYATPPFPTITQNGTTLTCSPADNYQWQLNSVDIPGATQQNYTYTQSGLYTVLAFDTNGCSNYSSIEITGVENVASDFSVSVFPNPSDGNFTVELLNGSSLSIEVVNTLGQIVESQNILSAVTTFNLMNVTDGVYIIEIRAHNELVRKKIVVAK